MTIVSDAEQTRNASVVLKGVRAGMLFDTTTSHDDNMAMRPSKSQDDDGMMSRWWRLFPTQSKLETHQSC